MLNLSRAWGGVLTKATPLPDVWVGLAAKQIKFRRGQVCMVAAAPNAGKSMFALIYAIKAKVPTLFFSADTDTTTVMMRAASITSGHSQITVESNLAGNSKHYNHHFEKMDHIKWVFDSSPSIDDLELEIRAYVELYGIAEYGANGVPVAQYAGGITIQTLTSQATGSGKVVQTGYEAEVNGFELSIQKIEILAKRGRIS